MLHYARSDTHYLLSIYDHLRLALHEKSHSSSGDDAAATTLSPLEEVYQRSIGVSSITFSLPPFDHETGHFDSGFLLPLAKHGVLKAYATAVAIPTLPLKTGWGPSELKFEVLRSVIRWREQTARDEDESGRYVLSLQGTLQLAEAAAAATGGGIRDANDVMRVLGGTRGGVSEVVRRRKDELAALVRETVERVRGDEKGAADVDAEEAAGSNASAAAILNAQLGLPAPEPAVRPSEGLWTPAPAAGGNDAMASTSTPSGSAPTVVSVSVAAASAFFGPGTGSGSSGKQAAAVTSGQGPVVPVAASSSFFGPAPADKQLVTNQSKKGKGRARGADDDSPVVDRAEAVKRVHDSLVLGGGLGQVSSSSFPVVSRIPLRLSDSKRPLTPKENRSQSLQPKPIATERADARGGTSRTDTVLPDADANADSGPALAEPDSSSAAAALSGDHTYVPLSGRIPHVHAASASSTVGSTSHAAPKPKDSDVIVVSSLKDKPKKRRRQGSEAAEPSSAVGAAAAGLVSPGEKKPKAKKVKAAPTELDASTSAVTPKKEKKQKQKQPQSKRGDPDAAPIVPFDYSTSTSILDADPAASAAALAEKKERKRQAKLDKAAGSTGGKKKGFEIDLSDFRRAPRVANAPKKANVSRSFAK